MFNMENAEASTIPLLDYIARNRRRKFDKNIHEIPKETKQPRSAEVSLPPLTTPEPGPERPRTPILEDLECSICKEDYSDDRNKQPRTLPCGHTFCTQCIESIMFRRVNQLHFFPDRNNNSCPVCRAYTSASRIEEIPISYSLLNVASNIKRQNEVRRNKTASSRPTINSVGFCDKHNSPKQFWCVPCAVWICGTCAFLNHKENTSKHCSVISVEEVITARKKLHESEHQQILESSHLRMSSLIQASDVCKTAIDSTSSMIRQLEESLRTENSRIQSLQRVKEVIRERTSVIHSEVMNLTAHSGSITSSVLYRDFVSAFKAYQKLSSHINKSSKKSYVQFQSNSWTKNLLLECFMEHSHSVFGEETENNIKRYYKITARWPDLCIHSSSGITRLPQGTIVLQLSDIMTTQCSHFFFDLFYGTDVEIRLNISLHEILSDYVSSFSSNFLNRRGNHFTGKSFFKLDVDHTTGSTIMWISCNTNNLALCNEDKVEPNARSEPHERYKFFQTGTIFVPIDASLQSLCSLFGILLNSASVKSSRRFVEIGVIKDDLRFFKDNLLPENINQLRITDCGCMLKFK